MIKCKPGEGKCPKPNEGQAVEESFAVVEKMSNTNSTIIIIIIILLVIIALIIKYYDSIFPKY